MTPCVELDGVAPRIGADVFIAPNATLIGDVRVGDGASVWYGAVLRGDFSYIEVGAHTSVQDNCVLHCARDLPTRVGERVIVGHGALLEGCEIEEGAVIGMGAVVLQRARIGTGTMLAAGAVVAERSEVRAGVLAAGVPAAEKKTLSGSSLHWSRNASEEYGELRARYLRSAVIRNQYGGANQE